MKNRSRLKHEIVQKLRASETNIGMLADLVKLKADSVNKAIDRESQQLCLPHFQNAICEVLGFPPGTEITEIYQPEIVHE